MPQSFTLICYKKPAVPVDRQKILSKGKTLKEDGDLATLKEGSQLMLMGTAEIVEAPKENVYA